MTSPIDRAREKALRGLENTPWRNNAEFALRQFLSALAEEGLCIVPKEPTEEMLLAAFEEANRWLLSGDGNEECKTDEERSAKSIRRLYRAMLAAFNSKEKE